MRGMGNRCVLLSPPNPLALGSGEDPREPLHPLRVPEMEMRDGYGHGGFGYEIVSFLFMGVEMFNMESPPRTYGS